MEFEYDISYTSRPTGEVCVYKAKILFYDMLSYSYTIETLVRRTILDLG